MPLAACGDTVFAGHGGLTVPVIFCEKLRFFDLFNYGLRRRKVFYGSLSLPARIGLMLFSRFGLQLEMSRIDFGHVRSARGIRGNAYRNAEECVDALGCKAWASRLAEVLGFDFWLLVQKYFFDEFYLRFEFIELALRFAQENSDEVGVIFVPRCASMDRYAQALGQVFSVRRRHTWKIPGVLASILLLPLFAWIFGIRKREDSELHFENKIVCEVDGKKTLEMFKTLFANVPEQRLAFVTERRRLADFDDLEGIHVLGLRASGRREIVRAAWLVSLLSLQYFRQAYSLGSHLFWIFYRFVRGRADTIDGRGNVYCTYEHLVTVKAVRNELLRASGNVSVFVPMNAHVTPQYFHSEFMLNYDVMLTAGQHVEDLYPRKRATTRRYLPTGSYDSHRLITREDGANERHADLMDYKGDDLLILVVSPGICDPTFNIELRLMALVRYLTRCYGVKVVLRLKPVPPLPVFKDFYRNQLEGVDNIRVTAGEYDLFDFVGVADLVVTSISNAAYDLAQAGATVMFVDYLDDAELSQCWSHTEGFPLPGEAAEKAIIDWIGNRDGTREIWAERMADFAGYIGYSHPDFDTYRQCVQAHVQAIEQELIASNGANR